MKRETKGWSAARRQQQAENIRKTRPWEHGTGPKTEDGKAKVAENALKDGYFTADMRMMRRVLWAQARFVRAAIARHNPEKGAK